MQNLLSLLALLLQLQSVTPVQTACLGSIRESVLPLDLYIAGVEEEGSRTVATEGVLVYLNGPALNRVRVGEKYTVVRPQSRLADPFTRDPVGTYYREIGAVEIQSAAPESGTARVTMSCDPIEKGDVLTAPVDRKPVSFNGVLSNRLTPLPSQGLIASVVLGEEGLGELASGQYCFLGIGAREGVKPGDRFTVYRPQPAFNAREMPAQTRGSYRGGRALPAEDRIQLLDTLKQRSLPPRVLGDVLIIDVGETTALGAIINSLTEMHPGDLAIRR
jgi:hypothetical protein